MDAILAQLQGDPLTNSAILAVVSLAVLDFLTGTIKSLAGGTFDISLIDVWVRKTLLGRVLTIVLVLGFGRFIGSLTIGEVKLDVLTIAGLAAAATFAAAAVASIIGNIQSPADKPANE
jgi:hypothetical protein